MKAITVRPPWSWAIAYGGKDIENRTAGSAYRGPLAIHNGRKVSARGIADRRVHAAVRAARRGVPTWRDLPGGAIIALAELFDLHLDGGCCRPWGESEYVEAGGRTRQAVVHLMLLNVRPLRTPVGCTGRLGIWQVPESVAAIVEGRLTNG